MNKLELPQSVVRLLWDVDPAQLALPRDRDFLLERLMQRGTWEDMRWLLRTFERADLREFIERKSHTLAPRERAYWALVTGAAVAQAPGGGRPGWAG